MPTSLTALMEAEAKDHVDRMHPVVELTLGGTVYRFAEAAVVSESEGIYLPYIPKGGLGQPKRAANITERTLEKPTFRFSVYDEGRTLQQVFGGPLRGNIRNSLAEIWWRSFEVPASDHYRSRTGVVRDYSAEDRLYMFECAADLSRLEAPLRIARVSKDDWPRAPEESIGAANQIIYGEHSSAGLNSFGMIKCIPLREEPNATKDVLIWAVGLGPVREVLRVWNGEVLSTSSFVASRVITGKNYYTILTYTGGDPEPTKESDIKCDVVGIDDVPSGGLDTFRNPATQMRHVLANFVYGTGETRPYAAWATEAGKPIASAIWDAAEVIYTDLSQSGSFVINSDMTGLEVLHEHCASFGAVPFLTNEGVAAIPRVLREHVLYYDDRHAAQFLQMAKGPLGISTGRQRQQIVSDLNVNYLKDEARNAYARTKLVAWRREGAAVLAKDMDLPHSLRVL